MNTAKIFLPGDGDFIVGEAVKTLRTNLQFCGKDVKVIEITAYAENEGKTMVSLQVARSFAELGKRVLFLDADMRKSVIAARNSNAKPTSGLSEILTGMTTLEEALWQTDTPGLFMIFSGTFPPNPVELLSSTYFKELIEKVREEYDYVIVDTPPLSAVIDAAVIATECDGSVLILGHEHLRYREVEEAMSQLKKSGCRILGAVRNKLKKRGYKYYYSSR